MDNGHFYYINSKYFEDFNDTRLMTNKEVVDGKQHNRPCFYAFKDNKTGLYWLIPISYQVSKYRKYYNEKIVKHHKCDTIVFGNVLGHEKAFLIQNMCPVTDEYIQNEYIDKVAKTPVRVDGVLERELLEKAKRVLALQRKGYKLIFPNVLDIEKELLKTK